MVMKAATDGHATKRPRGRPKTRSDEDRRKTIINEARHTFIELGYRGTTTDIVAARCHISKQTIYKIFSSKTDLFLAVVGSHRRMMLALPRPDTEDRPIDEVLEEIFMIDIDEVPERERASFISFIMREADQIPDLWEILHREGVEQSRKDLSDWLALQVMRGKLSIDDTSSGARMLMDLLFGGMVGPASNDWKTRADRRLYLRRCIDLFVRAGRPEKADS